MNRRRHAIGEPAAFRRDGERGSSQTIARP